MNEPSWTQGPPRSILLATDLSARSDRALDRAALLAKQWHSHLTILHVFEDQRSPLDSVDPLPSWRRPPDPLSIVKKNITDVSIGSEWGPPIGAQKGPHCLAGSRPEAA